MNEEKITNLVVKTVDGKRMVFTEEGLMIGRVVMTRETQDVDFANNGQCELLMKVFCKCE